MITHSLQKQLSIVRKLGPIDLKQIRRDSMLPWVMTLPVFIALLFRFGLPPVSRWTSERFGFVLTDYNVLLASFLVMMMPIICGTVIGFLLLDEKDDRTLTALQVTPLEPAAYLAYRSGVPMLVSIATTPVALLLSGLDTLPLGSQLLAALGAAPVAPVYALFVASFAENKVQGFALVKGAGVINWPPIAAYFVDPSWQWWFGLCPTYWQPKLYWELAAGSWLVVPVVLLLGWGYLGLLGWWFLRRFERSLQR